MAKILTWILFIVTAVLFPVTLYLVFVYVPADFTQGHVQKIFYYHVPSAWLGSLAFLVVFIASIAYLITRKSKYDRVAACSAEIGILFCLLVLITGPIWAKPTWGIWWTWDSRLTSFTVLCLIYFGYLMLRHYLPDSAKRANISAVVGIIGFLDVPIVYFSIRWWKTQHPSPVIMGSEGSGLGDPRMKITFFTCLFAFTLLYFVLMILRVRLEKQRERVDDLYLIEAANEEI
jgi:heme exporter protein C